MTASLTDRYVLTVLRRVPEKQRTDIERELRASIDDAVEARTDAGEAPEAAIEQTLTELGDPDRLADSYADRPQYLIGPELFPLWRRLALLLFTTVLPIVVVVAVIVQVFDDPTIGTVIGAGISAAFTTAAHMAFWSTAVFAVLERTGVTRSSLSRTWTLADLPRFEPNAPTLSQVSGHLLWPAVLIALLIAQRSAFTDVPVLDPAGWSFWWPYLIVLFVVEMGFAVWLYRSGTWTHTATAINAALTVLTTAPVVWLLVNHRFFNPEFLDRYDWASGNGFNTITSAVLFGLAIIAVWDIAEMAIRVERVRRRAPRNSYSL